MICVPSLKIKIRHFFNHTPYTPLKELAKRPHPHFPQLWLSSALYSQVSCESFVFILTLYTVCICICIHISCHQLMCVYHAVNTRKLHVAPRGHIPVPRPPVPWARCLPTASYSAAAAPRSAPPPCSALPPCSAPPPRWVAGVPRREAEPPCGVVAASTALPTARSRPAGGSCRCGAPPVRACLPRAPAIAAASARSSGYRGQAANTPPAAASAAT